MKIIIQHTQNTFSLDVDPDDTIDTVKCLIEVTASIPLADQWLFLGPTELHNHQHLSQLDISNDTVLSLFVSKSLDQAPVSSPDEFYLFLQANTMALRQLSHQKPQLYQAFQQGKSAFRQAVMHERITQVSNYLAQSGTLPTTSEEVQRRQLIDEQRRNMYEHHPESFIRVHMLYVRGFINDVELPLFLDTGAQQSVFSKKSAEECNIMQWLDTAFKGVAVGVGSRNILGRVHAVSVRIGNSFFDHSLTILDLDRPLMIIGLDFMLHHQAVIDLKEKVFRIGDESIGFLNESQVEDRYKMDKASVSQTAQEAQPKNHQPSVAPGAPFEMREPPKEKVKELVQLGVPENRAKLLLVETGGNVELAAQVFFSEQQ
ncbi:hypothetical protein P9112_011437 [Eukaryota sp. TZLM1-RC]